MQFIVSGVGEEAKITKKSLLEGYDEEDYQIHAIENRLIYLAVYDSNIIDYK